MKRWRWHSPETFWTVSTSSRRAGSRPMCERRFLLSLERPTWRGSERPGYSRSHRPRAHKMKRDATDVERGLWRAFVPVTQIPDSGLHREIVADEATRAAMAQAAGVRGIASAHASFDLSPRSGSRVQVRGRVQARVAQTCVVTLEPLENDIDEVVDLIFAPLEQIPELAEAADSDEDYEM